MWRGMINMSDIFMLFLYGLVLIRMNHVFPERFRLYLIVLNVGVLAFWMMPSKTNTKRKQGQTLFSILFRKSRTYHRIDKHGNSIGGRR